MEERLEAIRSLQTSLDTRLPDAFVPLLRDESPSIQCVAARAIGSRWWQIPPERIGFFVKALRQNSRTRDDEIRNMTERGLGLLQRDYSTRMFSRSPNKRWVIYERYGLPCLIDTSTGTEELLGWDPASYNEDVHPCFGPSVRNRIVASGDDVFWHPTKEQVAFRILTTGFARQSGVWVWRHGQGLRKLKWNDAVARLLRQGDFPKLNSVNVFSAEAINWQGDEIFATISTGTVSDMVIAWHPESEALRVVKQGRVSEN